MAKALETPSNLTYQTWVLKVLIHCEGCKKKVKKVLQSIDGVYTTTVDPQKHRVTVTGNVEANTLIKKLLKNGKHAALWPEEPKSAPEKLQKKLDNPILKSGDETTSVAKETKADEANGSQESLESVKGEAKTEGSGSGSDQSAAAVKKAQNREPTAAKDQGGNGNKKKKKGKKSNSSDKSGENKPRDPSGDLAMIAPIETPEVAPMDLNPPNHPMYPPNYLPMHYPPMAYTASYNTACPVPTASHYAPTPTSGGYILLHPRNYAPPMLPERICRQNEDAYDYGISCSIM